MVILLTVCVNSLGQRVAKQGQIWSKENSNFLREAELPHSYPCETASSSRRAGNKEMNFRAKPTVSDAATMRKLERIAAGEKPRAIDLFSGAGGISLGFHRVGFRIDGALEIEPLPALTHALNFHRDDPERIGLHSQPRDMTKLEPNEFAAELGLGPVADAVDVLVGGPPCQAYARVGRAKLREIGRAHV